VFFANPRETNIQLFRALTPLAVMQSTDKGQQFETADGVALLESKDALPVVIYVDDSPFIQHVGSQGLSSRRSHRPSLVSARQKHAATWTPSCRVRILK
jgi:hypothetical protein